MRTQKNLFDKIHSIVQLNPDDENILQKTIFSTENATAAFFVANYINVLKNEKTSFTSLMSNVYTINT